MEETLRTAASALLDATTEDDLEEAANAALLELGDRGEREPDAVAESVEALDEASRRTLAAEARREFMQGTRVLGVMLREGIPDDELLPPVLAPDPFKAEKTQAWVIDALRLRESLHRLARAAQALGIAVPEDAPLLARLDAKIRALLPRLRVLAPARSALALKLETPVPERHWWFTEPIAVPDEGEEELDVEAAKALTDWVTARKGADGVLHLEREEARALLATPRGRRLAEYLEGRVDVSAAAATAEEYTRDLAGMTVEEALRCVRGALPDWAAKKLGK